MPLYFQLIYNLYSTHILCTRYIYILYTVHIYCTSHITHYITYHMTWHSIIHIYLTDIKHYTQYIVLHTHTTLLVWPITRASAPNCSATSLHEKITHPKKNHLKSLKVHTLLQSQNIQQNDDPEQNKNQAKR